MDDKEGARIVLVLRIALHSFHGEERTPLRGLPTFHIFGSRAVHGARWCFTDSSREGSPTRSRTQGNPVVVFLCPGAAGTVLKVEGRIMKRIRFLRWGSRISSTGSAVKLVSLKRQVPFGRRCESSFLMQLAARFRAQWKQAFGWKRSSAQCSYDPYSYSLNFDDGLSIP
ncbi:hypothetical protein D5086_005450 [Populus alba]|uniref:Uncharacterized protein n=1 Tax=Populus alba TaxID=43335 RepID=A0ACC4CT97_POPAL